MHRFAPAAARAAVTVLSLFTCACEDSGSSGATSVDASADTSADVASDTANSGADSSDASAAGAGERTLGNCTTTFAADVPAFYKKYFRCVTATVENGDVVLKSTDLPPHKSPYYPKTDPNWVAFDTQGGQRFQNPNTLSQQAIELRIPSSPQSKGLVIDSKMVDGQAGGAGEYSFGQSGAAGLALDGVGIFHGVAAPGDDLLKEEKTFDTYEGHPQMTGVYHYHGPSPGPLEVLKLAGLVTQTTPGKAEVEVYGILCDGTLMLGCTELDGTVPDGKDFDAQNGHVHDVKDKDGVHFAQRYHTHVCRSKFKHLFSPEIQYYATCGTAGQQQGQGPKACTTTADCTGACPASAKGCTCTDGKDGKVCVPTCASDGDCPTGGPALKCEKTKGICIPG